VLVKLCVLSLLLDQIGAIMRNFCNHANRAGWFTGSSKLRLSSGILVIGFISCQALAAEPDNLSLPQGFHATVVADGLGAVRHLAVRENGDIYVSTLDRGIFALHLDAKHRADQIKHFGAVQGGTGIGFYRGRLYATTATSVYRFTFSNSEELIPEKIPQIIMEGMPVRDFGFNRENRTLALDGNGNLFVGLGGSANLCVARNSPAAAPPGAAPESDGPPPVGLKPCPDLGRRSGVWRFSANKLEQKFPTDGEQLATGIRDMTALAWSPSDTHVYGIMHGRDDTHKYWPAIVSATDEANIADEMDAVSKGTDFGWPYTYYDGARKERLVSPEYGGDGRTLAPSGIYSTPVLTFAPRSAPVDLVFYSGDKFPASYRGGGFVVLHGTGNKNGYDVVFVPLNRSGAAGPPAVFASGFAAFSLPGSPIDHAKYRPVGIAVGPDGALYLADSQQGRIWRIAYGE
jgi:glucose/arabinose dehydrogenase